jgi:hypothetical protein
MAHFAKINENNIVQQVIRIDNNDLLDSNNNESETKGIEKCTQLFGDISPMYWKQTSYNTKGGVHLLGGTPLRKNYAGIGHSYDSVKDAFIPPKPYSNWNLNETTCQWEAPSAKPEDSDYYIEWSEANSRWEARKVSEIIGGYTSSTNNYYWDGNAWQSI